MSLAYAEGSKFRKAAARLCRSGADEISKRAQVSYGTAPFKHFGGAPVTVTHAHPRARDLINARGLLFHKFTDVNVMFTITHIVKIYLPFALR